MKKFDKVDWIVLLSAGALLWLSLGNNSPKPEASPSGQVANAGETAGAATPPAAAAGTTPAAPGTPPVAAGTPAVAGANSDAASAVPTPAAPEQTVVLKTAVAEGTFTTYGGGLKQVKLLPAKFAGKKEQILNPSDRSMAAIGSLGREAGKIDTSVWAIVEQTETSIVFENTTPERTVRKTWSVRPEATQAGAEDGPGYFWDLKVSLKNNLPAKLTANDFYLYAGSGNQISGFPDAFLRSVYHADGKPMEVEASDFKQDKRLWVLWELKPAEDIRTINFNLGVKWAGTTSQYYTCLVSPKVFEPTSLWMQPKDDSLVTEEGKPISQLKSMHTGVGIGNVSLEPQASVEKSFEIFVGPRSNTLLAKVGEERREAMFYGFTGPISRGFLWMLNKFNGWAGGFGIAIVLLTIVVRMAIWPLSLKAYRSMKKMGKLSPMMTAIKDRYKDKAKTPANAQKQQQEMMQLYREYEVSPLGGCLPVLLQMPIFFGYFGMLNHAVEMRGHSFLWAKDLIQPDTLFSIWGFPVNPLPLLMTLTMYLQMKLTPMTPPTPGQSDTMAQQMAMQQKMFKIMPLFFLLFCYFNPSALALYWTVQNIVSILQTYAQKLMPEPELKKREVKVAPAGGAPGGLASLFENAMGKAKEQQAAKGEKPKGPKPPRPGGRGPSSR